MQGLENNTFDVGASSDPAKFSKSLKNIENYIQKTYKDPDDMVKTTQQMTRVSLSYPEKPKKTDKDCCDSNGSRSRCVRHGHLCMEGRLQIDEIKNGQV